MDGGARAALKKKEKSWMQDRRPGQTLLFLYWYDLFFLGLFKWQHSWGPNICIGDAGGGLTCPPSLWLEVRLVSEEFEPWSQWFLELAIIRTHVPGISRLSGSEGSSFILALRRGIIWSLSVLQRLA